MLATTRLISTLSAKIIFFCSLLLLMAPKAIADVTIASTTSLQDSGFYAYILPMLEKAIAQRIKIVSVGTGQALKLGENGDVDMVIVHAPDREAAFIKAGFGIDRTPLMTDRFIIIGPRTDPAKLKTAKTAVAAFQALAKAGERQQATFVSRGDSSGTNIREQNLWHQAGIQPQGHWYIESGTGMGATLNITAAINAYTLTDTSTWMRFDNKQQLTTVFAKDPALRNQYSAIIIPRTRYPNSNAKGARAIIDWLASPKGQRAINAYQLHNKPVFKANAKPSS